MPEILEDYPGLTTDQVEAAIEYAKVYPKPGRPLPARSFKRMLSDMAKSGVWDVENGDEPITPRLLPVTVYLLDENVIRELRPGGNATVRAWHAGIATGDLRISALTFFEKRRGWERRRKKDPALAAQKLAELDFLEASYGSRVIPIDGPVAAEWTRLLGAKDKNQRDRGLAATARVHGFVLVTRNIDDVRGCDVDVLDPFSPKPVVQRV